MKINKGMIIILILIFSASVVCAEDLAISNSEDWKDVYSTMLYSSLKGVGSEFLTSSAHSRVLHYNLNKNNEILVFSSSENPFAIAYDQTLQGKGFNAEEEILENANLELIEELPEIDKFIIVSPEYGYSAISVASYAAASNSWVFFADRTNIVEIESFLNSRNPSEVMLYGHLEEEVIQSLEKFNPEIINNYNRFEDNLEIVDKFLKIKPTTQVLLTNGEFLEKELISGINPVLFTGKTNVPEITQDYIKNSDLEVGVLVGNDLIGSATNIRQSTGISVIVKFARGSREPVQGISAVEALDMFYLPRPLLEMEIYSVKYNTLTSNLELTLKSNSNIPAYFKSTINLKSGEESQRFGDLEPVFIAPGEYKTITYSNIDFQPQDLTAEIFTLYGEFPSTLDYVAEKTLDVEIVSVLDRCEIEITQASYNKQKNHILIQTKNLADYDCYVLAEIHDITINGLKQTISSQDPALIKSGKTDDIVINQRMTEHDIQENPLVNVHAFFGENPDFLVQNYQTTLELKIDSLTLTTYIIIALIILIILVFLILIRMKRRED